MDANDRLDQLEPVISEMLRKQDNLAAQNQALAKMFFELATAQAEMKAEMNKEQAATNAKIDRLAKDTADQFDKLTAVISAIYQAIQKPSGN
jgi:predicted S18 family serine protease